MRPARSNVGVYDSGLLEVINGGAIA